MKRTAWIWAAGCAAWTFDGLINLRRGARPHAELAFLLAALFAIAYAFYRQQNR